MYVEWKMTFQTNCWESEYEHFTIFPYLTLLLKYLVLNDLVLNDLVLNEMNDVCSVYTALENYGYIFSLFNELTCINGL